MSKEVKVYSTPTCPYCIRMKQFFKEKNVQFADIDVSSDQAKAQEMVQKSGQMAMPVVEIGTQIIVGFDRDAIAKALNLS